MSQEKMIPFIDLGAQYRAYKSEIDKEIAEVLNSSAYILGPAVSEFEREVAEFVGCKYAHACSSGTDALLLSLMALGIGAGDEVITTPFSFIATAEVVALLGAKPIFVDICTKTYNISPKAIESAITPRTKAILPVSLYGLCANFRSINKIAQKHNIAVIEDGCQSFGAEIDMDAQFPQNSTESESKPELDFQNFTKLSRFKRSGAISTIGTTSFFPSKPLGCYGDGGAVFTDDKNLSDKIAMLLNHGQKERYKHEIIGINGRLDSIQCAILRVKLRHFKEEFEKRQEIAKAYTQGLKGYILQSIPDASRSAFAQFSIRLQSSNERNLAENEKARAKVLDYLKEQKIPSAIHYPIPLHLQPAFAPFGGKVGDCPNSELASSAIFSIPFSPFLEPKDQEKIISALNEAAKMA